ncbi:MAG TPA: hypothetical protein VGJ05_14265 [Fimbriiglobus sp.]|jgi:hypothetical protein
MPDGRRQAAFVFADGDRTVFLIVEGPDGMTFADSVVQNCFGSVAFQPK